MTPELAARKYQFREGFHLVDYGEVGLPIFRLTLEAITMAPRFMPTIQEFAMRCLALGETNKADVANMLGLKLDIVVGAMNVLITEDYVTREPNSEGADTFHLTEAGELRLLSDRLEIPQEEMIVVDYDGIRRIPLRLTGESVVRPALLQGTGAVQIRPYPAEAPGVDDLAIPDISKVIRRQRSEDFRRTVLSLKRVVRRNNLFREGVALVYAADKSDEVQVAFVIDDKLSDAYELAPSRSAAVLGRWVSCGQSRTPTWAKSSKRWSAVPCTGACPIATRCRQREKRRSIAWWRWIRSERPRPACRRPAQTPSPPP
jgi:hypothetical protein